MEKMEKPKVEEVIQKVKVLDVIPPDTTYTYAVVRGCLHASDCSVFGLTKDEKVAMLERYSRDNGGLPNIVHLKGHVLDVINSLGQLGYRVIASCGENEISWTLQREI